MTARRLVANVLWPVLSGGRLTFVGATPGVPVRTVVPLDGARGERREFLLVPYFGACIHSPPPPINQIVHVSLHEHAMDLQTMDAVWVTGSITTARQDSVKGEERVPPRRHQG